MKITDQPSPNFDERGCAVDMIVLHYTGMKTGAEALARLCDPAAKVSAHYLVEEDGRVFHLVAEEMRAWHAGVACWAGDIDINARSIGIEIVNPGHEFGYRDFPAAQIAAVIALLKDIRTRRAVPLARIVGHSDVAPRRKEDPGEKFPWSKLALSGQAVGPYEGGPEEGVSFDDALSALRAIGYDAAPGDYAAAVLAFQRRFCPASLGQGLDPLTRTALTAVAASIK